MKQQPGILLCTIGTSLMNPSNLGGRNSQNGNTDWQAILGELVQVQPTDRVCGAEINSVCSLLSHGYLPRDCGIFLFHSETDVGRHVAEVLVTYFKQAGHAFARAVPITDLQDQDPKRFRTKGLRNLAKEICQVVRNYSSASCAINATGGYKAQIAIAVLLGQSLGIPVYYMHEKFSEIIAFPPLPVALDFQVWMRASGMLAILEREEATLKSIFSEEWEEKYESLVNIIAIDGQEYLELSPTGCIFHETFRERFRTSRDTVLPPPALKQHPPELHDHGVINLLRTQLSRYFDSIMQSMPFVTRCITNYCNPDLPEPTRFRIKGESVEGIYSDGTRTVKFDVASTATTQGQREALVAALNIWLENRK